MLLKLPSNIVGKLSPNIAIYCLVRTEHKRAFLNDLGQIHEVCSFEDIGNLVSMQNSLKMHIIADVSKILKTVQRNLQNLEFIFTMEL